MTIISTDEAERLLNDEVPFVDVRTPEEFGDGHVPGAINVPISFQRATGMVDNPDFLRVIESLFDKDSPLIVACKAGGRSARAAGLLENAGFQSIYDMTAGFEGKRDPFGRVTPGWGAEGREIETNAADDQTYEGVLAVANKRKDD